MFSRILRYSILRNCQRGKSTFELPLAQSDPELWSMIQNEKRQQRNSLYLIASENFTHLPVLECLGSCLSNKYAEGYPGARYYGGNRYIDDVENLARSRLLQLFRPGDSNWGVNVQPYGGSPANFAVFTGLLNPHDRIMGLDLPDGGHLTHGFFTPTKRISASSIFFESMPYKLDPKTELIDYDMLQRTAKLYQPKLIIAGITAYSRLLDYQRFREICDSVGAFLLCDMSHISGLVAAGVVPSPFDHADVVSSTTHKTLRGPRAGMIFYRNEHQARIDQAVFPTLQGGPHENAIAGIAAMAHQANSDEFKAYAKQILSNAKSFAASLESLGYNLVSGGTDVHLLLVNLLKSRKPGLGKGDGARAELVANSCNIVLNKNTVPGDVSAMQPSGLRFGTPALTSRGFKEADFDQVAKFIDQMMDITVLAKGRAKNMKEFRAVLQQDSEIKSKMENLSTAISQFAQQFPLPGKEDC